ncbi:MAG: hypothetical protein R2699_04530 [Acidimicrobiales bacterium]
MSVSIAVPGTSAQPAPASPAPVVETPAVGERYLDQVFSDVKVTKNIKYSRQLNVNGWEDSTSISTSRSATPPASARRSPGPRRLVRLRRQGRRRQRTMATELRQAGLRGGLHRLPARSGNGWASYTSIQQALSNDRFFASLMRATNDIGFASSFLRANAATYRLHPEAIFASGHSAGAVASLTQAYLPAKSWTRAERLAGVASLAGMTYGWYAESGEPPAILFHGTKDGTVPYSGAKDFCDTAGVRITCELVTFTNGGHGITGDWEVLREGMAHFFYEQSLSGLGFTTEVNPIDDGSTFHPITPERVLDTRTGLGGLASPVTSALRTVDPSAATGVPDSGVSGVVVNVTVTGGTAASHLTVGPGGAPTPTASTLNWAPGTTRQPGDGPGRCGRDARRGQQRRFGGGDRRRPRLARAGSRGDRLHTVPPERLVDTRTGLGAPAAALFGPGETMTIDPTGHLGVPEVGATGIVANVTVTDTTAASHLTAWPTGTTMPASSNLNWAAGTTVPNMVITRLGADGTLQLRNNSGTAQVIVDVVGWLGPEPIGGRACRLIGPTRVLDTRDGTGGPAGVLTAGGERPLTLAGAAGIPSVDVGAVFGNATATSTSAASHLTIWPAGATMPTVSNLNWSAGQTVANHVVLPLGTGGAVTLANHAGTMHAVLDATAWC